MTDPKEIDRINILQATFRAMTRAVARTAADALVVDGLHPLPGFSGPQTAVPQADGKSTSVAAASIIAKVFRDDIMAVLDGRFPGYGFRRHKGYATRAHFAALDLLGPCATHRQSFLVRWRARKAQREMALG